MAAIAEAFILTRPKSDRFYPELNRQVQGKLPRGGLPVTATPKVDDGRVREEGRRAGGRFATFFSQSMGGGLRSTVGLFSPVTAGLAGLAAGIFKATNMASDLNETVSKADVIFGSNSSAIQRWASNSVRAMGLTRNEAIGNATAFGDMFQQLGITGGEAVNMSEKLVQLAADQASFSNADITQVLEAQQAAFRGEYDALQRFIPNISAARVEQEALAQTHKRSATELTAAEKAQATYTIMMRDSVKAQGDFARTSQGAANQQRILRAGTQEFVTQLGQYLLPLLNGAVHAGNELLPVLGGMARFFGELPTGIKVSALALGGFIAAQKLLGGTSGSISRVADAYQNLVTKGGGVDGAAGRMTRGVQSFRSALAGAAASINPVQLGLVGLSAIVGYFAQKKADAAKKVDDFTQAIRADSGALGDNTRQLLAQRLEQDGALKAAQQLNISLRDLTSATLGDSAARERVNAVLDVYARSQAEAASAGDTANVTARDSDKAYQVLKDTLGGTNAQINEAAEAAKRVSAAAPATKTGVQGVSDAAKSAKVEVTGLNKALGDLLDKNISAAQTSIDFRNKLAGLTETIKTNGTSLSLNTQKGRDNRSAVIDLIDAAKRNADAIARQTGNENKGTDAFRASIPQIVTQATKLGLNKQQVQNLINTIANLKPKTVPVTADVRARNVTLSGSRVSVDTGGGHRAIRQTGFAEGGRVQGYSPTWNSDNIDIRATAGEFVVQRRATERVERQAPGFLDALNAGKIRVGGDPDTTEFVRGSKRLSFAAGGLIEQVKNSLASKRGDPYVWGAVGPNAFDCSGLVSWAYGLLTGKGVPRRYFTTDSIGSGQGFRPGLGTFSVGVTPGRGHMAGNLAGFGFEATPPAVRIGGAAKPVTSFARRFFLPQMGGTFMGNNDWNGFTNAQLSSIADQILPAISQQLMASLTGHDTGGPLLPGELTGNISGGRERILNAEATRQYENTHIAVDALREAIAGLTLVVEGDHARFVAGKLARAGSRGRGR